MNWLISKINKEFNDEFSFLKLLEVKYSKQNLECAIVFLYPENIKNFDEAKQLKIIKFINKTLDINAKISVKFRRSYLDNELIIKSLLEFLKTNYASMFALFNPEKISLSKEFSCINLDIPIDANILPFIDCNKLSINAKTFMESKFCCEFIIHTYECESKLEEFNYIPTIQEKPKAPRYEVEIFRNLFGGEISPKPEFIKNIKSEKQLVILAGKIESFEKKSYQSKKPKDENKTKYYFSFELNDTTSKIDVKYFTTVSNEKKMDKLLNGDEVIILGDIKEFNKKLSLYIKAISRCKLPKEIKIAPLSINTYEAVFPEKHSILEQENLFTKSLNYVDEIYQNTYVVFDVETTGLDYENDELLEIGAVKIENGNIVSKFVSLIKPAKPIPKEATIINNITDSMVQNSPNVDVVIRDFLRFSKNSILVGYNVAFDQKFIQNAGKKQSIIFENQFSDVLPLAKTKLRLTRYKLTDVVKRLEITLDGARRALADALATAEAFLKLSIKE